MAAGLILVAGTAMAEGFGHSSLQPGQWSDPRLYDINAVTITQNSSSAIQSLNSVSCNNGVGHTANSYMRRFDLNGVHGIVAPFAISQVDFGVEEASSSSGAQAVILNLYVIENADPLTFANLTGGGGSQIGNVVINMGDQSLVIHQQAIAALVPSPLTHDLVVEVFTPDGRPAGNLFFIGSNNLGQTAPSYLAAADCGVAQPTPTGNIGFPDMHIYMAVTGTEQGTPTADVSWGRLKTLYR
jgi:hypothetical protein